MKGSFLLLLNRKRNKIFLVLRSDFPVWGLTGGGLLGNESYKLGAIREAIEETGFRVRLLKKIGTCSMGENQKVFFEGRVIGGKFVPEYPGCKGRWFYLDKLPKDTLEQTRRVINEILLAKKGMINKKLSWYYVNDLWLFLKYPSQTLKYFLRQ